MDITESLAPASDQLDAIELVAGPRTFVVESVIAGNAEQPVQVRLEGFPRVWRPSKGMRRVLAAGWGVDASKWAGRSVTLFFDPSVTFGKDTPGGTRIAAMTDLPGGKRLSAPLLISRGKSAMYTVEPLTESAPNLPARKAAEATPDVASIADRDVLTRMWKAAPRDSADRAAIEARVAELNTRSAPTDAGPSDADWDAMGAPDDAADGGAS